MRLILGFDPGAEGAAVALNAADGSFVKSLEFKKLSLSGLCIGLKILQEGNGIEAIVEKVGAMPGQGVVSMFSFGQRVGEIHGILTALKIPIYHVTPQEWQKSYGFTRKRDKKGKILETTSEYKNRMREYAQTIYPKDLVTRHNADALLIARWLFLIPNLKGM